MQLLDVNVLVHAYREDAPRHPEYLSWLTGVLVGDQAYGISELRWRHPLG
jgi:uncharacterized protein